MSQVPFSITALRVDEGSGLAVELELACQRRLPPFVLLCCRRVPRH
jgi:hypothetical protein